MPDEEKFFTWKNRTISTWGRTRNLMKQTPEDGCLLVFNCHNVAAWRAEANKQKCKMETDGSNLYITRRT